MGLYADDTSESVLDLLHPGGQNTKPRTASSALAPVVTSQEPKYGDNGMLVNYIGVPNPYQAQVNFTRPAEKDSDSHDRLTRSGTTMQDPRYLDGAEFELQKWSTADIARLQIQMVQAGLLGAKEKIRFKIADTATIGAYKDLLAYANVHGLTKDEAMDELMSNPLSSAADGFGAGGGPSTTVHTRTDTTHFDDLDARAMANDAFAARTGREAKGEEAEALQAALNAYASAHPAITKSTVTDDGSGNTNTVAHTTGGVSAAAQGQIAVDQAQAAPDYAEYQAAGFYFPVLESMLGATADVRGR
jgi:hypothetical protein